MPTKPKYVSKRSKVTEKWLTARVTPQMHRDLKRRGGGPFVRQALAKALKKKFRGPLDVVTRAV